MRFGYLVRPKADRDIDDIADFIAGEATLDLGVRFLAEVYKMFALIAIQPEMGWQCRISHPQLKSARVFRVSERFANYLIFYQPYKTELK